MAPSQQDEDANRAKKYIRRRISRACDQCNQLRTKCDGKTPCEHCVELNIVCEYVRERKKRGKASRKELAQQVRNRNIRKSNSPVNGSSEESSPMRPINAGDVLRGPTTSVSGDAGSLDGMRPDQYAHPVGQHFTNNMSATAPTLTVPTDVATSPNRMSLNGVALLHHYDQPDIPAVAPLDPSTGVRIDQIPAQRIGPTARGFEDVQQLLVSPSAQRIASPSFRPGDILLNSFMGTSPSPETSGCYPFPSSAGPLQPNLDPLDYKKAIKYPVLQPLLPHVESVMPVSLACDLLDLYSTSAFSIHLRPVSPYLLGQIFRKESFLSQTGPRQRSPALLASILWIAAQTSDSPFLTSPPSARGRICQTMLELTVRFLKPLIHGPSSSEVLSDHGNSPVTNGVAIGGLGVAMTGGDQLTAEGGTTGVIDDIATYIHLATVVSASEYKAASLRWWNAAWSLARESKFGRELPPLVEQSTDGHAATHGLLDPSTGSTTAHLTMISEERREERRRIWWLLYIVDRHLALCYNRPLFLLDAECDSLLQPLDDLAWQAGRADSGETGWMTLGDSNSRAYRRSGPQFLCTGLSTYGYWLPLMTILGEIVDLNQARNHPRFGPGVFSSGTWDHHVSEIQRQLEAYGASLKKFEDHFAGEANDPHNANSSSDAAMSHSKESVIHAKTVVAYGTHVMHVLHILLTGKWDPINLFDDDDLFIGSQSFVNATGHAVAAAEAINDILEYDPDLSFMPWFFGIYLLQGSFLLLLIADKLQGEARSDVVRACDTVVRAHEACVVTLNTEYQRNFRKVMRSALAQVRGRNAEDFGEQQARRREVLSLYRWINGGTGLAL